MGRGLLRNVFFRNWWLLLFIIFCSVFYFQGSRKRDAAIVDLSFRLQEMEKAKMIALQKKEDLQLRLQSQNDPAWIEMILMRDLGVVPEGWVKIRFRGCETIK